MGKIKIGIGGIPIGGFLDPVFQKGLTDDIRAKTIEHILNEGKKMNIDIAVTDIGEFIDKKPKVTLSKLDLLGREFRKTSEEFDFLGIYGIDHVGAYILYHARGKVDRFDAHDDNYFEKGLNEDFTGGTYMYFVFKKVLKLKSWVTDHALVDNDEDYENFIAGIRKHYTGKIFDIDVDAHKSTYIKTADKTLQGEGLFSLRDFKVAIREAKPNIIGIFEYNPKNTKRGEIAVMSLMYEGVKARL